MVFMPHLKEGIDESEYYMQPKSHYPIFSKTHIYS